MSPTSSPSPDPGEGGAKRRMRGVVATAGAGAPRQRTGSTVSVSYTSLKASTGMEHVFAAAAKRRSVPKPLSYATAARQLHSGR